MTPPQHTTTPSPPTQPDLSPPLPFLSPTLAQADKKAFNPQKQTDDPLDSLSHLNPKAKAKAKSSQKTKIQDALLTHPHRRPRGRNLLRRRPGRRGHRVPDPLVRADVHRDGGDGAVVRDHGLQVSV